MSVALLYFVLLMSLAGTGVYPPLFRAGATLLFREFGSHRIAEFTPVDDAQGMHDTRVSVGTDINGSPAFPSGMGINSVREGYTPAAFLAALILATPISWTRKWRALVAGLFLVQVFVALRLAITLMYGFSRVGLGERQLLEVGQTGIRFLRRADQVLTGDLHMTYIAPILIWLFVTRFEGEYFSTFFRSKVG